MKTAIDVLCAAHLGQALDLGTDMKNCDWAQIPNLVQESLRLKSGQLAGCAILFGAIVAGAEFDLRQKLFELGCEFGMHLQAFDDLGNLRCHNRNAKHLEDLKLRRPSYVWSYLAEHGSPQEKMEFLEIIEILDTPQGPEKLQNHLIRYDLKVRARAHASAQWKEFKTKWRDWALNKKSTDLSQAFEEIFQLGETLVQAYE